MNYDDLLRIAYRLDLLAEDINDGTVADLAVEILAWVNNREISEITEAINHSLSNY